MKKALILLLLLPFSVLAQIADDFSDGDFIQNPNWSGTVDKFVVNTGMQLQLNAEEAGIAYLSLPIMEYESMEWQFWIREAFAPSGNNFTDVWLCADNADLTQVAKGYFLRFGEGGSSDAIEMFRKDADGLQRVLRGGEGAVASSFAVAVKITCDREGNWVLRTCYDNSGVYTVEAQGTDETLGKTGFFGFCSTFTASNAKKIYFDNFYVGPRVIDHDPPLLLGCEVLDPLRLQLSFNEALSETSALNPSNYMVDNGLGSPISAAFGDNAAMVVLEFEREISGGVHYTLSVSNIKDLWDNMMEPTTFAFSTYEVSPYDILINEILFNPIAPGVDYVELYNPTDETFDLSTLMLGVIRESFPNPADTILKEIASESRLLLPQTYVLLSTNSEIVGQQYECSTDNFVQMASFPSYANSGGTALLMSKSGTVIDQMVFSESMHYPLLKETKGVSLERVSFDQSSLDANNWHSAAERVHFGTPGYENSMMQSADPSDDEITISPDVFSPDGDGFDDACFVSYHFDEAGYTMNIYIFNVAGQLNRHLAKGELIGQEGSVLWNGLDDNNNKVPVGVYVVVTEVFNFEGKVKQFRNAVVVGTR